MICITAIISITTTVAYMTNGEWPGAGMPGRQPIISDLVLCRRLPRSDKDGGSR